VSALVQLVYITLYSK